MSKYKKCKLINQIIVAPSGTQLNCFGHKWIVDDKGDAYADIHVDFHKVEVAAGRYVVVGNVPEVFIAADISNSRTTVAMPIFTMDIKTYYGAGDLEKLRENIEKLKREGLRNFAKSKLSINLPPNMGKEKMMAEIIELVTFKLQDDDDADRIVVTTDRD